MGARKNALGNKWAQEKTRARETFLAPAKQAISLRLIHRDAAFCCIFENNLCRKTNSKYNDSDVKCQCCLPSPLILQAFRNDQLRRTVYKY